MVGARIREGLPPSTEKGTQKLELLGTLNH